MVFKLTKGEKKCGVCQRTHFSSKFLEMQFLVKHFIVHFTSYLGWPRCHVFSHLCKLIYLEIRLTRLNCNMDELRLEKEIRIYIALPTEVNFTPAQSYQDVRFCHRNLFPEHFLAQRTCWFSI